VTHSANNGRSPTPKGVDWQDLIGTAPDTALEQAGLCGAAYHGSSITLYELSGTAIMRLHSLRPFEAFGEAMVGCDLPLPALVNQSLGQDPAAICLAPGEWLLFSEYLGYQRLVDRVRTAVDPRHTAALDLSAGLAVFRLSGSGSRWLLKKLGGLDFQRDFDKEPRGARTRLQQVPVTLHYHRPGGLNSELLFDLIFDRSFAHYLWHLLIASVPHAEELERNYAKGS